MHPHPGGLGIRLDLPPNKNQRSDDAGGAENFTEVSDFLKRYDSILSPS